MSSRVRVRALWIFAIASLAATPPLDARDIPPAPSTYVFDEADWLTPNREQSLSRILHEYERESSNQIVVAVFESLQDEELADFSQRVAEAWKIGQANRDNGILLAFYASDRLLSIEVGYGLEPVVTDLIAQQIRTRVITPYLKQQRHDEGVLAGTRALIRASRGEFEGSGRSLFDREQQRKLVFFVLAALILFVVIGVSAHRNADLDYGGPTFGDRGRTRRIRRIGSLGRFGGGGGGFGGGGGGGGFRGGGGGFGGGGARGGW